MAEDRRVVVILQPSYLPWVGCFDLASQADVWVWYDDVQYTRRDWRNRNRVAGDGEPMWLTVPVRSKGRFEQSIHEVEIDYARPWARKHLETIRRLYQTAPCFEEVFSVLCRELDRRPPRLADLTIGLNEALGALLGLAPRYVRSSALGIEGGRQERLIEICRHLGGQVYLSGPAAESYIDPAGFERASLELRYAVYDYPPYPRNGRRFIPGLSIVDALCWLGASATAAYIRRHSRWRSG